jgi:hypothetical protein
MTLRGDGAGGGGAAGTVPPGVAALFVRVAAAELSGHGAVIPGLVRLAGTAVPDRRQTEHPDGQ